MLIGSYVLQFFGISMPIVRVAGGLLVTANGWHLLNSQEQEDVARPSVTDAWERELARRAFFPLTFPLTVGPGSISVAITLGARVPARGISEFAMFATDLPDYSYDPKKAESLLDEAGFPRDGDGTRFAVNLLPAPWFQQTRQTGDYVKQALQQIGIAVTIVNNDPGAHNKAVYTDHAFDLAIGSPVYRNDPAISTTVLYQGGLPAGVPFSNQTRPQAFRIWRHAFVRLAVWFFIMLDSSRMRSVPACSASWNTAATPSAPGDVGCPGRLADVEVRA